MIFALACGTALAQVSATGPATKRFFDNANLVCKCKVSSNVVLNEQVIAQPGGSAIRRKTVRATLQIQEIYKSDKPNESSAILDYSQDFPVNGPLTWDNILLQDGGTYLMFLARNRAGTYSVVDPNFAVTAFASLPVQGGEPGLVKLESALAGVALQQNPDEWRKAFQFLRELGVVRPETILALARAQSLPAGVVISYALPSRHLALHEPVIVTFNATNSASQPIKLDLGGDFKENFLFIVKLPDGTTHRLGYRGSEGLHVEGGPLLKPGESYSQNLLINERYDFPVPGQYKIQVYLMQRSGPQANYSKDPRDPGLRATLQIGPKDESVLSQTCDNLAKDVEGAKSYKEATEAASALSYINDPVAVPYLKRVMVSNKFSVRFIAILGLARIRNDAAIQALKDTSSLETGSVLSCIQEGGQVIDAGTCVGASRPPNPKAP